MFRFFKKNREAVKKYLLIFFLGIVSLGMVITLAPISGGDTTQMQGNVLASIDGAQITTQDLQRNVQAQLRNSPLGSDPRFLARVANTTLDEMVIERAIDVQARKLGVQITEQELVEALQGIPWLYSDGKFIGIDAYQTQIQEQTGMTVPQFEAQLRRRMLFDKVRSIVVDPAAVTPVEVHEEFLRRNAKAKVEYVVFDPTQFLKSVEVTPDALEAYFKKDPARYKVPEQRQVRYVLIDPDHVRSAVRLDDATLKQYYSQHLSDYRVPERVKVAHILFKTTGKSANEVTTIENTARQVLSQIKSGADFAEMARKYSEDTPNAQSGGELGWVVRNQTVKEFESAAFSMKPGQVSDLVKTTYGIHIIKLEDKQSAHLQTFDEVKGQTRREVEQQQLAAAQQSLARQIVNELKANPKEDLESAARKLGLEARETPLFNYNDVLPDFGKSDTFSSLAFQLRPGEVGEPIGLPKGLAVIQLVQAVPEHVPTLDEVRGRVSLHYRDDQSKTLASEKAKEFAAKVKGADFKKVAKDEGLEVKESNDFTRQDSAAANIPGSALTAAFTLDPGQMSDVVPVGQLRVVFRVLSHTPANESDFASQQTGLADELLERKRAVAFEIYQQNLKEQLIRSGELKMNDAAMKQFLAQYQSRG